MKNVYYSKYGECAFNLYLYILSKDKLYLIAYPDIDSVKEISNSNNYVDIYMDYLHDSTCDSVQFWLGHTADGKYYDLSTSTEYIDNTYYYYDNGNNYIKKDKSYKFGDNTGKIKLAFLDSVNETLNGYIDENNYLYKEEYDEGEYYYKLISNSKVVKVEYLDYVYHITLANGETKELTYSVIYE